MVWDLFGWNFLVDWQHTTTVSFALLGSSDAEFSSPLEAGLGARGPGPGARGRLLRPRTGSSTGSLLFVACLIN